MGAEGKVPCVLSSANNHCLQETMTFCNIKRCKTKGNLSVHIIGTSKILDLVIRK